NIEILWENKGTKKHFIFQSIQHDKGYILCFKEEKQIKRIDYEDYNNYSIDDIPGIDDNIIKTAKKAVKLNKHLLITGETGVGKEILARAIHKDSIRKGPFIPINCMSIPKDLIESELFGYEVGAFTGAYKGGKRGKIELADNGTLFLDEIGDMPFNVQGKLLRIIENKELWRIGATEGINIDFQLICATNRDLKKLVRKGIFREDLYYRICFFEISLSLLKNRIDYLDGFIEFFLNKHGGSNISFSNESMKLLKSYLWPGNIRELEMVIELLIIENENINDKIVQVDDLPLKIKYTDENPKTLNEKINVLKNREIRISYDEYINNNITKSAQHLGITREGL
ncbi:sigma 54-interacting transcriptional regulator, partial [candidate division WOR-3 bacterium]|nr:sigma 54-interacting transcriptional regulator [candidate division WOR-3 bacterium]